jgi:hypothetical protein
MLSLDGDIFNILYVLLSYFFGHLTTLLVAHLICQGWPVRRAAEAAF